MVITFWPHAGANSYGDNKTLNSETARNYGISSKEMEEEIRTDAKRYYELLDQFKVTSNHVINITI